MSAAGAAEEENCDSIKRFVSGINIQTSSLDDFIRISNITRLGMINFLLMEEKKKNLSIIGKIEK